MSWERSRRAQQLLTLRSYAARAGFGSLLPATDAVLAFHEEFLQSVLERSLPTAAWTTTPR